MKFLSIFVVSLLLLNFSCKSTSPQKTSTANSSADVVEMLKDTLKQIENGRLYLANGTSKALSFSRDASTTTLVLVRHAEKAMDGDNPDDPGLTPAGQQRAERLADILQNFPLSGVYTTNFIRTTKTAQPSAYQQQLDMQFYDASKSADFVIQLAARNLGKNFLIVGHSNTVPLMLNRLLGESRFSNISETDYSNIYVVSISKEGQIRIVRALY